MYQPDMEAHRSRIRLCLKSAEISWITRPRASRFQLDHKTKGMQVSDECRLAVYSRAAHVEVAELGGGPHCEGVQVALAGQRHARCPQAPHTRGIVGRLVPCQDRGAGGRVQILRAEGVLSEAHALSAGSRAQVYQLWRAARGCCACRVAARWLGAELAADAGSRCRSEADDARQGVLQCGWEAGCAVP